jgi:putative peptidoglycan lipid II flippase
MSAQSARGEMKELMETWSFSNRLSNFITIPAAVGLIIVALPITSVLWLHGEYKWNDVQLTAYITMAFAPGLVAISMMRNTVQVFYALEDMKSPVWVSVACLALNFIFGIALLPYEVVGLATAFTLSSFVQLGLLISLLRRKLGKIGAKSLIKTTARQCFSATAACGLAFAITLAGDWSRGPSATNVALLLSGVLAAIISYAALEFYFGSQEAQKIWALVRDRVRR